jgi:hypothetical protein
MSQFVHVTAVWCVRPSVHEIAAHEQAQRRQGDRSARARAPQLCASRYMPCHTPTHTHTHTHTHTRARVLHVALVGVKLGDGEQVIATFDFADDDPEKLSFVKGDILQVSAV